MNNVINHIAHILQRITTHPHLPILPLPPILPVVPILTPLSPSITCPDTPSLRLVPVVQPQRVKPYEPANTAPPRVKRAPSPAIDPYSNPCIEVVYNNNNTTPTIPTEPKPALPCQVQHFLRRTPINVDTNLCAQSAKHLAAQHMFNLPHAFRVYNSEGKKEKKINC